MVAKHQKLVTSVHTTVAGTQLIFPPKASLGFVTPHHTPCPDLPPASLALSFRPQRGPSTIWGHIAVLDFLQIMVLHIDAHVPSNP